MKVDQTIGTCGLEEKEVQLKKKSSKKNLKTEFDLSFGQNKIV